MIELTPVASKFAEQVPDVSQRDEVGEISIIQYLEQTFADAINLGASDVHFEPYERVFRIRFRVDGILYEIAQLDLRYADRIAARLKVIAGLNIAEKRLPQDGRFSHVLPILNEKNTRDFRMSTCPTSFGEKVVVRILNPNNYHLGINELGMTEAQQEKFLSFLTKPQGMVLVTGPTGSGKTLTLYTALKILNDPAKNISTAEDPIELNLFGINQVEINYRLGLSFVTALRAFLRQDPDIIMLGEIRDAETAEVAIKAAQTGHLVLSTLHTNSAFACLERLHGLGLNKFNMSTAISLIVAQRLLRKLCLQCRKKVMVAAKLFGNNFSYQDHFEVYEAVGCKYCKHGFCGRTGIFELMPISPKISQIISSSFSAIEIAKVAQHEGMKLLREHALNKVLLGVTSLAEVNRVLGDERYAL